MVGIRAIVAALVIGSAAVGCGRTGGAYDQATGQPAAQAITVSVQNDYMLAMDIYAVSSGVTHRLGQVGPGMSQVLVLDPGYMPNGIVDIVAQPPGGGRSVDSGTINPVAGQTVDFYIGNRLLGSHASIR